MENKKNRRVAKPKTQAVKSKTAKVDVKKQEFKSVSYQDNEIKKVPVSGKIKLIAFHSMCVPQQIFDPLDQYLPFPKPSGFYLEQRDQNSNKTFRYACTEDVFLKCGGRYQTEEYPKGIPRVKKPIGWQFDKSCIQISKSIVDKKTGKVSFLQIDDIFEIPNWYSHTHNMSIQIQESLFPKFIIRISDGIQTIKHPYSTFHPQVHCRALDVINSLTSLQVGDTIKFKSIYGEDFTVKDISKISDKEIQVEVTCDSQVEKFNREQDQSLWSKRIR